MSELKDMKRSRTFLSKLVGIGLLIVFCWSGGYLFLYAKDEYQMHRLEKQLDIDKQEAIAISEPGKFNFSKLKDKNEDTIGWINIGDTAIDYPVVQAEDNRYYLNHDYQNNRSVQGSIFMDYRNQEDIKDNHIIFYGHNMKNGTMFHDLNKYKDENFLNEHRYINFYGETGYYKWEVFSTYNTDPSFNYIQTEFGSSEQYLSFINQLRSRSDFSYMGEQLSAKDKVLTLSTCSQGLKDGRRVVHARLIEERAYAE